MSQAWKLTCSEKWNYVGFWKSKLGIEWSKTHPAVGFYVFLIGAKFALKPELLQHEKKTSRVQFSILTKTLTCKCPYHWYLHLYAGVLQKNQNYWLEVFFIKKFEKVFLYILPSRSTRWPILKSKTTSFCISFSFFEFLIKFCLKIMYHLSY